MHEAASTFYREALRKLSFIAFALPVDRTRDLTRVLLIASFFALTGQIAHAQQKPRVDEPSPVADTLTADTLTSREAIRAVESQMAQAVQEQDLETLRALWAEAFMVNAPRNVVVPNREAVLDVFRKGIPNYATFAPTIESLRIMGATAVVMGHETVKPVGNAPHAGSTVQRRYTHVWKNMDGRWQLIARHAHITSID